MAFYLFTKASRKISRMLSMKTLLIFLLLVLTLNAQNLDEIISSALENSPSLEVINERILANKENISVSDSFSNPEVLILTNTIDSREPMSQSSIRLKQNLPYFGKQEAHKNLALAQGNVLENRLESAKSKLIYLVKIQAYKLWELERVYKIICDYEDLTKQNLELYESYTSTSDNQHMGIMSAELALSDLRIQKSFLLSQISSAYARLSYLSASEISQLDLLLDVEKIEGSSRLKVGLENNRDLLVKDKEIEVVEANLQSVDLDNYPDIALVAGYSYRENFDNYASFGLGLSLPIYGSEDSKSEEARRSVLASRALREDTRLSIEADFQMAYAQMKSAYETYHIINDQALPQLDHMFELINSSVSAGADLFKYIDILIQKLQLEKRSISAMANYNIALAKIEALRGEID